MDVENVPMDIDGLSMLKSSSSSSWVNRGERRRLLPRRGKSRTWRVRKRCTGASAMNASMEERHCRRIGCCAPMPLSCLDDNNARTMRYNRRTWYYTGSSSPQRAIVQHIVDFTHVSIRTDCEPLYIARSADDPLLATEWPLPVSTFWIAHTHRVESVKQIVISRDFCVM